MATVITETQLLEALNHALAAVHEFDDLDGKLAVFGLQPEPVHRLLQARWLRYRDDHEDSAMSNIVFVRAFVEGLLTGMQLARRHV